jgi:hypothetical protein
MIIGRRPWSSKKRWQFSMRTLIIAMTLIAVAIVLCLNFPPAWLIQRYSP